MTLRPTPLAGAWVVEPTPVEDERGWFARTWSAQEMATIGADTRVSQCSVSYSRARGTLRGLHFQRAPHAESKLVRCTQGAVHDVIVDLRPESPTYRTWFALVLTAENRLGLFIPAGLAHGFLTLADHTELSYQISTPYEPSAADGVRWNDPALAIVWPEPVRVISTRDDSFPLLAGDARV
jgi:dTDP-4-dehydrorhamnose 3,5-epimerase